jgi:hypothetical protein
MNPIQNVVTTRKQNYSIDEVQLQDFFENIG